MQEIDPASGNSDVDV